MPFSLTVKLLPVIEFPFSKTSFALCPLPFFHFAFFIEVFDLTVIVTESFVHVSFAGFCSGVSVIGSPALGVTVVVDVPALLFPELSIVFTVKV